MKFVRNVKILPFIHNQSLTRDDFNCTLSITDKSFKFDVGVKLKRPLTGPIGTVTEFEVLLISISHISGHYDNYEAVYSLTSTANYYHIWEIYDFGCNYGTAVGFVPTFSVYF